MTTYPDFKTYVSEYHFCIKKFLNRFNEIGLDEVHKSIREHPEIKTFLEEELSKYDLLTSEAYFEDSSHPYDYEDKNGFRYNSSGDIVRYPKKLYEDAREEYVSIRNELSKYL